MKKKYSILFLASVFIFSVKASAQIIYTDVIPDFTTAVSFVYNLDLNNDGTTDFIIDHSYLESGCPLRLNVMDINANSANEILQDPYSGQDYAARLGFGDAINALNVKWSEINTPVKMAYQENIGGTDCSPMWFVRNGPWFNISEGYVGLRLQANGNTYYGWVRLSTDPLLSFTIKDYAYNTVPDQEILAGEVDIIVPLDLLSFGGVSKNNRTELTWSTANEVNNKGFEVEKSTNGRNYIKIGSVNGKGNTVSSGDYHFTDGSVRSGINYYRLKQVDIDNKYRYSAVIRVQSKNMETHVVEVSPNPLSNTTSIRFSISWPQKVMLNIYDINGRLLATVADKYFEAGRQQVKWNKVNLEEGIYLLKIESAEFTQTEKLVISK